MKMEQSFFEEEVRHGFYINPMMKRGWAAQMEVLQGVDDICRKYNIRWFSHYGTMLGAVRHGGFVPWDDDMDICMLREDYDRFAEAIKKENTELRLYGMGDDCDKDDFTNLIARVMNSDHVIADKVTLEKYHQCIYASGIDIFILDYVSKDKEFEKNREQLAASIQTFTGFIDEDNKVPDAIHRSMEDLEVIFNRKINWGKPLERQLLQMLDLLYSECPVDQRSDGVALLQEVYNDLKKPPFHVQGFDSFYEVPLEMMQVRLSKGFLEMMKIYYYNFALYYRGGGGHVYPFYEKQYELFTDKHKEIPFNYTFDKKDLPENLRGDEVFPKEEVKNFLKLLEDSFQIGERVCASGESHQASMLQLLENIQQLAIHVGTVLEAVRGNDFPAVHDLEAYIEEIYQYYTKIQQGSITKDESFRDFQSLRDQYQQIKEKIKSQYLDRKEVLLIPYRAAYWYSMQSIYEALKRNLDTDVYVMPVPLHHRDAFGIFTDAFYEGNLYPAEVGITDYKTYDPEKRVPDEIYIGTDYDDNNPVISVEPAYYAENLVRCTPKLNYIPFMLLDENLGNDWLMEKELKLALCQPGMVRSDYVFIQSEHMKEHVTNVLHDFVGEEDLPALEKKLVTEHYPVISYIESLKTEDPEKRTRDFYYLSIAGILYEGEIYLDALKDKVQELIEQGDMISLVLEQRAEVTLKTVDQELYDRVLTTLDELCKSDHVARYSEPKDFNAQAKAVAQHDAYYGDQGPVTWLFQHFHKSVQINTLDYNKV
jgi:phosphorylcholine metabolism protein LicD